MPATTPSGAFRRALVFLKRDLWIVDEKKLPRAKRWLVRLLKWVQLVIRGFREDRLMLRASALTYATVLSIVPFLAVAFSLLKGFGFQNTSFIRDVLLRVSAGREEVVDKIITYINQTNVGTLGVLGTTLLLVTVISLLSNIEGSFNTIWRAQRGRPLARKVTEYISLSLIFPLLLVTAISITATLESSAFVQKLLEYSLIGGFYLFLLKLAPLFFIWLAFSFINFYIPNTKVKPTAALAAGVIAGAVWQAAQGLYITFQFGAAKYNAIYGSFAQLPMFLIWVYVSWVIVLLGAEMAFAFQNLRGFELEAKFKRISLREQQHLGLALLVQLSKGLHDAAPPPAIDELADAVGIPATLTREILFILEQHNLVGRLERDDDEEERYTLLRDPADLRISGVLETFRRHNEAQLTRHVDQAYPRLRESLAQLDGSLAENPGNLSIRDLERNGFTAQQ